MKSFGFIILRHVMNTETNRLWNECYRCIRRIYTDIEIVIVDDGSCSDYVQPEQDLVGVRVIDSEFPGGGEVLPLY